MTIVKNICLLCTLALFFASANVFTTDFTQFTDEPLIEWGWGITYGNDEITITFLLVRTAHNWAPLPECSELTFSELLPEDEEFECPTPTCMGYDQKYPVFYPNLCLDAPFACRDEGITYRIIQAVPNAIKFQQIFVQQGACIIGYFGGLPIPVPTWRMTSEFTQGKFIHSSSSFNLNSSKEIASHWGPKGVVVLHILNTTTAKSL